MHDMTSENKYALAQRGEAKSIDIFKFILASDSIILSRDGHHVGNIVKIWYEYYV